MLLLVIVMSIMIRVINGVQGGSQSGLKGKIELMNGHFPGQCQNLQISGFGEPTGCGGGAPRTPRG